MGAVGRSAAMAAVAALAAILVPAGAVAQDEQSQQPIYLALGDSWAAGSFDSQEGGYVNRLYDDLRTQDTCPSGEGEACEDLELRNLAVGGATTSSLIANQLPEAVALIEQRNRDELPTNNVAVVTVTIGGNDIFGPIAGACLSGITEECRSTITANFQPFLFNLAQILATLRGVAGADTAVVVTAYDNPIPTCALAGLGLGPLGADVLEGGAEVPVGLNDLTRLVAEAYGVDVAQTFGALEPGDWVGGFDCLHPNGTGHEKVKDAFLDALDLPSP